VRGDGHLGLAGFRSKSVLVSGTGLGRDVHLFQPSVTGPNAVCVRDGGRLLYRPSVELRDQRLAIRIFYADQTLGSGRVVVDADDPDRPFRYLQLRQSRSAAELIDLGTTRLRAMSLVSSRGSDLCIDRLEIGSLTAGGD
jgi:hypothetical protein